MMGVVDSVWLLRLGRAALTTFCRLLARHVYPRSRAYEVETGKTKSHASLKRKRRALVVVPSLVTAPLCGWSKAMSQCRQLYTQTPLL